MKLSMMTYTVTRSPEFDLVKMLELTKELELAGIDICFADKLGRPVKELRKMLDDYGIPVVCNTFGNDINAPGMAEKKWEDNLKAGLEEAVILGAPVIMIPTPGAPGLGREENRGNWLAVLGRGVELAGEYGIKMSIENFPGEDSPFVTADDFLDAVKEAPELKLTYDNGNAASGEEPAESFRRCSEHVVHAHFKDWYVSKEPAEGWRRMLDGQYYRSALIGEGAVDHASCIRAMEELGYKGCVNIEYEGNKYNPYEGIKKAAAYLRETAEKIKEEK
jgi:sugar phosphate isomerase/epimerase